MTPVPWKEGQDFVATKLVLTCADRLLVMLRDDFDHIPFPAHWDLPGGGREGDESAPACALRELQEEFGLQFAPSRLRHWRAFRAASPGPTGARVAVFYAGEISEAEIAAIRFGDEGSEWRMMPVAEYLSHDMAVPHFPPRVRLLLALQGRNLAR